MSYMDIIILKMNKNVMSEQSLVKKKKNHLFHTMLVKIDHLPIDLNTEEDLHRQA